MLARPTSVSYAARTTLRVRASQAVRRRPTSSWLTEADGPVTGERSLEPLISKVFFSSHVRGVPYPRIFSQPRFSRRLLWPLSGADGELDPGLFQHCTAGRRAGEYRRLIFSASANPATLDFSSSITTRDTYRFPGALMFFVFFCLCSVSVFSYTLSRFPQ
jgi:hypothetical protein